MPMTTGGMPSSTNTQRQPAESEPVDVLQNPARERQPEGDRQRLRHHEVRFGAGAILERDTSATDRRSTPGKKPASAMPSSRRSA